MIEAIVKLQGCTTRPGRRAFVSKQHSRHGIAAGTVRYYRVIGSGWPSIRRAVASCDSATGRTMGFTAIHPDTVECWRQIEPLPGWTKTESRVTAMPKGWGPASLSWPPEGRP